MKINLSEFAIKIRTDVITPESPAYRPPSWPPPRDWPVALDANGAVVSRWGDPIWDLSPWVGKRTTFNFGDGRPMQQFGRKPPVSIDTENADLLRMLATWLIWGPRAAPALNTVADAFKRLRGIVSLCSRNGISAAALMRFPRVLEKVPSVMSPSKYETTLALLHRLYDSRETLGFAIVDPIGLKRLADAEPPHDVVQTPYIPPRIWLYQVTRLRECLTDFLAHREQLEALFRFCLNSYIKAHGSLEAALAPERALGQNPFHSRSKAYQGPFYETAARFGVAQLLTKWIDRDQESLTVREISSYFSLVTHAGAAYIANFTLQRKEEVCSLRAGCLLWDVDEQFGPVPIICGETTKTDPDSDARWVASPSVEAAIEAMSTIAHLRMECDRANPHFRPTKTDQANPYLLSLATEPWGTQPGKACPYTARPVIRHLDAILGNYELLLDREQMRITPEDLRVALRLTPNLKEEDGFAVREIWPLAWHQYRRTGAVNMFASGDISDSSMQQQMKHSTRLMPLYYGRNHSRLHFNKDVEGAVITAMYQSQAALIKSAASDDRFVSPHSAGRREALAVNVLSAKDTKDLIAMAKRGTVAFREHRLGGCMKVGTCEYGGIESVTRCGGGDGGAPCTDVLYDRNKEAQVRADMHKVAELIKLAPAGSPRYNALSQERQAMENYLNAI